MEKRLSYKKPKPHHFYTFLAGMCNTVPWLLMCDYFQLLMQIDVSFQDIMLLSGELFMGTASFFYNIVLAGMYGGIRS